MKSLAVLLFFLLTVFSKLFGQSTWNATSSPALWSNPANWSTGIVPGPTDAVVFNATSNINCDLDIAPTIASITINGYTGTIDMRGNNWTITSAHNVIDRFATGSITNSLASATLTVTANSNSLGQIIFSGTLFQSGVNVTADGSQLFLNGSTFNGTCSFIKWGTGVVTCTGGNTFNGVTTVGVGFDAGEFNMSCSNPDIFNNSVTLVGASNSILRVAYRAQCTFNGDVTLTNTTGLDNYPSGVYFGDGMGSGGSSVLAAGKTLSVTDPSFSGVLIIDKFTQSGSGNVNLIMNNSTGHLYIMNSSLKGNIAASGGKMDLRTSTFSGTTNLFGFKSAVKNAP